MKLNLRRYLKCWMVLTVIMMKDSSSGPVHYKGVQWPFICLGNFEQNRNWPRTIFCRNGPWNLMWVQMRYIWNMFTAYKLGLGTAQRCDLILNRAIFPWTATVLLHSHQRWEKNQLLKKLFAPQLGLLSSMTRTDKV